MPVDERKESVKLRVRSAAKSFSARKEIFEAVNDVSLDVYENEFLVILGPGQCGKSVLLNMISGLETPTAGTIEFTGGNRNLGFVFQKTAVFPWKTVMENVELAPQIRGVSKAERRKKAQYLIELVGLAGFESAYPRQLSGGMKQRVGIARAYCSDPDILLMDEPFGALDAQTRTQLQTELLRTWEEEKKTCFFITHDVEEAILLASKVIIMSARPGRIREVLDIDIPYPRTQETKILPRFTELKNYIWNIVYREYLEVQQ